MKIYKTILIALSILLFTPHAKAEENYWKVIREYMRQYEEANTREAIEEIAKEGQEYLDSLTAEQLIIAGRQCSEEAERICPDTVFCEATTYLLGFFYVEYPKKGGLKNLERILKEIEDKSQTNFWRASLIDFLGHGRRTKLLALEQLYEVIDKVDKILADKSEHYWLCFEASQTIRHILGTLEERNLLAEPIIKTKIQNGEKFDNLKKAVAEGKIVLSDNYKIAQAKTLSYYDKYAQKLLMILQEPNVKPRLQREAIGVLAGLCLGKPTDSNTQINNALHYAVRNYERYNESLWRTLLSIGFENIRLSDIDDVAEKMLRDVQAEEHKRDIQSVIKNHKK